MRLRRVGLLALMALAAVNLFTGAPLLALWIGARVQGGSSRLSMSAVVVVVGVLAVLCVLLVRGLARLGAAHEALGGHAAGRRQTPWLKPFNSPRGRAAAAPLNALDQVLVAAVVLAVLAFEAWFFLLAGSSLPAP